jgi:endonuclease/exonuclease/phosphatase family metal-dependent hydrolase
MLRKFIFGFLTIFTIYIVSTLAYGYFNDWIPESQTTLTPTQSAKNQLITDSLVTFISWNMGYGGLGKEADFSFDDEGIFYSGSSMVRSPKAKVEEYVAGAINFLKNTRSDFFLLQEVDMESDRSYRIHQYDAYSTMLPEYSATFAPNYKCKNVPIPVLEPWNSYGKVLSGLATFSRFQPKNATSYLLPGKYPMPDRLFQLDRCVLVQRYATNKGHDLVVINLHNAAYDPDDKIKKLQLPYLHDLAIKEYEAGNYVILGGDWNQCPPFFKYDAFSNGDTDFKISSLPSDLFPENWLYGYDPTKSTNRKTKDPYIKGKTFETLIDYYAVSPNLKIQLIKTLDLGFSFSDHQPVYMEILLK